MVAKEHLVRVLHPGHLAGSRAHVWRRDVDAGADKALLGQLHCVAAGDALELVHAVLARVNADAALGATKWHVDHGALVRHEAGEGLDLLQVDRERVADAALARQAVVRVLRAVALDDLDASVVAADREAHADDIVALLDDLEDPQVQLGLHGRAVKVQLDHFQEARLAVVLDGHGRQRAAQRQVCGRAAAAAADSCAKTRKECHASQLTRKTKIDTGRGKNASTRKKTDRNVNPRHNGNPCCPWKIRLHCGRERRRGNGSSTTMVGKKIFFLIIIKRAIARTSWHKYDPPRVTRMGDGG